MYLPKGYKNDQEDINMDNLLERIAQEYLHINTLKTQKSDSLDFHDCAVWSLKAALEAAYNAGQAQAGNKSAK